MRIMESLIIVKFLASLAFSLISIKNFNLFAVKYVIVCICKPWKYLSSRHYQVFEKAVGRHYICDSYGIVSKESNG